MAKAISEEQLQLRKRARRRLIGAIALVTVVAVFLPMVLDHEPREVKQDINIQIPPQNSGTFTSKIVPVSPEAKKDARPPLEAAAPVESRKQPDLAASATPPAYDTEAAPPLTESKDKPARSKSAAKTVMSPAEGANKSADKAAGTESVPKVPGSAASSTIPGSKSSTAEGSVRGYVVQVAALTDAEKAKQMQEQIAATGVKAYTEVVATKKGNVTRVRAGPFATRDEAEKVRTKFKDLGLSGNIVPKGSE